MQSTGHSSIHVLSLMSTQGSVIVYVTKASSISGRCGCCLGGAEATSWCRLTDACRGVSPPNSSRGVIRLKFQTLGRHQQHRMTPLVLLLRALRGPALLLQIRQRGLFLVLGMSLHAFLPFASDRRCCCSSSTTARGC